MKVGLFLGYGPDVILGKEGLGRYLGKLIKNLLINGNKIIIACPKWSLKTLQALCQDFQLNIDEIDFVIANRVPVIWNLYYHRNRKKIKVKKKWLKGIKVGIDIAIDILLSVTNFLAFVFLIVFGILAVIVSLPFLFVGIILYFLRGVFQCCREKGGFRIRNLVSKGVDLYEKMGESGIHLYSILYNRLLEKMQKQLVAKINKQKGIVDVWYSPAAFWPVFNLIDGPKVINVPDLVTEEFATKWGNDREILYSSRNCEKTIENGVFFITYSKYIRDSLLIKKFGKKESDVFVIPHSVNDLSGYVTINNEVVCKNGLTDIFTAQYCKNILEASKGYVHGVDDYIIGYHFDDVKYIFYPSQARPHKNLLNLIKAYEVLLRKKYVRMKLFLTCDLSTLPEIKEYIISHRLQYDILSFYNVGTKELAALYHQAELVVNPTLYEGGVPFTFGEGMSVGTPSVMGAIPQVLEMSTGFDLDDIFFDPYNVIDIVNKIEYGINNKEILFEKENRLYQWMLQEYSMEKVGALYVQAFSYAIEKK